MNQPGNNKPMEMANEIDVVIPVYNQQEYITRALISVDRQTLRPNRIIVIDDGSTDQTAERIHAHIGKIPLIYIRKANGGLSSARNAGIQASTARFIAFLDADDEWAPEKLTSQYAIFQKQPFVDLGVVYCQYDTIDEHSKPRSDFYVYQLDPKIRGKIFNHLLPNNSIASSASGVLVKRECFAEVGLFDEKLRAVEDWDMWLRLSQRYSFDYVNATHVHIRRHSENMQRNGLHMFTAMLAFYNKWIALLPSGTPIPKEWGKYIVYQILGRLPKRDYSATFRQELNPVSRKKMMTLIRQDLAWYVCLRLALTPFTIIRNLLV